MMAFARRCGALGCALAVACGMAWPAHGAAQKADRATQAYAQGVRAYRAADFDAALKAFETAERRGLRTPNLDFNIGLTCYQLGRYEEARQRFLAIRNDLRYTALADYHLGLVSARLGEIERAHGYFEAAQFMATTHELRQLAGSALQGADEPARDRERLLPAGPPRAAVYARLGSGFDTNAELLGEPLEEAASQDEPAAFGELAGDLDLPFLNATWGSTYLHAGARARQYGADRGLDQQSADAGLRQTFLTGPWQLALTAEGSNAWLEGDAYEGTGRLGLDVRHVSELVTTTLHADVTRVGGEGRFVYLDGSRQRLGLEFARQIGALRGRLDGELELNDRRDLVDGDTFSSYSPRRTGVGIALGMPWERRQALEARLRWRGSDYPDAYRFEEGGALVERERVDRLVTAGLRGRWRAGRLWNWLADVQYNDNQSTLAAYEYSRAVLLVGVEWLR